MSNAIELAENLEKIYPDLSYKKQLEISAELRRLAAIEQQYISIMAMKPVAWQYCDDGKWVNGCQNERNGRPDVELHFETRDLVVKPKDES